MPVKRVTLKRCKTIMKFSKEFHILIVIITISCLACVKSDLRRQPQAKQNNFVEWLISIFQFNPIATSTTTTRSPISSTSPTEAKQCQPCSCGTPNVINRIVGGEETQEIRYPWMALLKNNNRFYCGGSLISDRYVATAAHCLRGFVPRRISVSLLVHDREANSSREINGKVKRSIVNERYNPFTIDNDIGLLELTQPVELSDVLRPVCMPMPNNTYVNDTGIASGWGALSEGGPLAQKLMQVSLPIITNEECDQKYGGNRITPNMMCAGIPEGGKDSCQGDSGGPFQVHNDELDTFHLAGIVSWGEGCARPNKPGVYTRVTQYLDWLAKHTKNSCHCEMPSKKLLDNIFWESDNEIK